MRLHTGLTSAGQPGVCICVHEQLHPEEVADLLGVEGQDTLKEDHVSWVHRHGLLLPAMHKKGASEQEEELP